MRALILCLLLAGCAGEESQPVEKTAAVINPLSPERLLIRASLDLRGVRPSTEELAAVESDPQALDAQVEGFLQDERFEERVRDLWSEIYLTQADYFSVSGESFGLDEAAFAASVGEEPLRILGEVAASDLPWTEIVRADWTMADESLAAAFPLDYPEGGTGWQQARYTDGRPAAGVLSTNGLWWRYTTTDSNANRGRANAVSRILLCNDYLVRPISFERDVDLLDGEAVAAAIRENPACVNCHASLDPLAAYLFGFLHDQYSPLDASSYHPERERLAEGYLQVEPAFYGQPGYDLSDLGRQIAADPRFAECAVEQAYTLLMRRPATLGDADALTRHREAFLAGGLKLRPLLRSILSDPGYRAEIPVEDGAVPRKMVTPALLASMIEDLTGYSWTTYGYDMLGTDLYGVRTLSGGADGITSTRTATEPSTTLVLVQERLAWAAAAHVVAEDLGRDPAERRLFTAASPEDADEEAIRAQLVSLHRRLHGSIVQTDGPEVEAGLALFQSLAEVEPDPATCWTGVLAAMLRDPEILFY